MFPSKQGQTRDTIGVYLCSSREEKPEMIGGIWGEKAESLTEPDPIE